MSSSVRWVACTTVVSGPSRSASCSSRAGLTPYAARQASFSATCSDRWMCSGARPRKAASCSRGTARTEWIAAGPSPARAAHRSASPSLNRTLHPLDGLAEAAGEVRRVEQAEPQPGLVRCRLERLPHRVRVVVRRPVGPVVQVVELADARVAGGHHLAVRRAGQREVGVGLQPPGDVVHQLAPRPERPPLALGPASQRAVERVAVAVRQAGDREAGQAGSFTGRALQSGYGELPTVRSTRENRPSSISTSTSS